MRAYFLSFFLRVYTEITFYYLFEVFFLFYVHLSDYSGGHLDLKFRSQELST